MKRIVVLPILAAAALPATAGETRPSRLTPVPVHQVRLDDEFWAPRLEVWRRVTLPDCLDKFEEDGAFDNFDKIRDGDGGEHAGPPWYDGLVYEMIRAAADFLAVERDQALEARLDGYIERIAAAASADVDGYLNTYTQLEEPDHRWGMNGGDDNWQHDVYNAGALVEAGVHYYQATGKTRLLEAAARLANHMADVMGPPPGRNVVPGHSLSEEALVKLHVLFLKIMGALPGLLYAQGPGAVYVNLYAGSRTTVTVDRTRVALRQTTPTRRWRRTPAGWRSSAVPWSTASRRRTTGATSGTWSCPPPPR